MESEKNDNGIMVCLLSVYDDDGSIIRYEVEASEISNDYTGFLHCEFLHDTKEEAYAHFREIMNMESVISLFLQG